MEHLNIQSIFNSIDGEVNAFHGAGELCTFIRLRGCNLNCNYCDTKYAQDQKPMNLMTIDEILAFPQLFNKITITGGEPLIQRTNLLLLVDTLLENGHRITIETNGTEPSLAEIDTSFRKLRYVVDYKLPSSGMEDQMVERAFTSLTENDVIKFVIMNDNDYHRAKDLVIHRNWSARKVFSPGFGVIDEEVRDWSTYTHEGNITITDTRWPRQLAEMMLDDYKLLQNVQFSLQLHKILWPNAKKER